MSKSADPYDEASKVEDDFRNAAIAAVRKSLVIPKDFDGENCYDCDEPIPPKRLALQVYRCIYCQTKFEHKYKGY